MILITTHWLNVLQVRTYEYNHNHLEAPKELPLFLPHFLKASWMSWWLQEAAGALKSCCEQSFSLSTSGTAAGAQRELETRRSFKGALCRGHPKESLLPGLTQQSTHKAQVDLSCSKSLLHVLLTWSSCSCSFCLKFGVLLNHWAVNTNPFCQGWKPGGKDSNSAAAELLRQNSPQVHCCEGRPGARRQRGVFHC